MITVYLNINYNGHNWVHCKEVISKMGGYLLLIPSGFGQRENRVFFPAHNIERIDYGHG